MKQKWKSQRTWMNDGCAEMEILDWCKNDKFQYKRRDPVNIKNKDGIYMTNIRVHIAVTKKHFFMWNTYILQQKIILKISDIREFRHLILRSQMWQTRNLYIFIGRLTSWMWSRSSDRLSIRIGLSVVFVYMFWW